jgi:hypothetical protein
VEPWLDDRIGEQAVMNQVALRLAQRLPAVPVSKITNAVNANYEQFADRPIRISFRSSWSVGPVPNCERSAASY